MDEILREATSLAQDQYGNYVVQHVLQHGGEDERKGRGARARPRHRARAYLELAYLLQAPRRALACGQNQRRQQRGLRCAVQGRGCACRGACAG